MQPWLGTSFEAEALALELLGNPVEKFVIAVIETRLRAERLVLGGHLGPLRDLDLGRV